MCAIDMKENDAHIKTIAPQEPSTQKYNFKIDCKAAREQNSVKGLSLDHISEMRFCIQAT